MTTPERALELADMLNDEISGWRIVASRQPLSAEHEKSMRRATDTAAILRHYAEIMQAEPVAEVCNPEAFVQIDWEANPATVCSPFSGSPTRVVRVSDNVPVGAKLIIKPAP